MSQGSFKTKRTQTVVFVLSFGEFPRNVSRIVIEYFCNKMLVLNLSPRHYFTNIILNISSRNKVKVCFMTSIERAVESTIKPFVYLIRKPRNNQKQSVYSIVGHPVELTIKYFFLPHCVTVEVVLRLGCDCLGYILSRL